MLLQALKQDRNEKENGHIEQMILLNQAKEKLDELKIELKEAKQEAKTLEEKTLLHPAFVTMRTILSGPRQRKTKS